MKDRVAVAMRPGLTSGKATSQKLRKTVPPSTQTASSRSRGTSRKNPIISQTASGDFKNETDGDMTNSASGDLTNEADGDLTNSAGGDLTDEADGDVSISATNEATVSGMNVTAEADIEAAVSGSTVSLG